jgi:hypothetical protein
MSSFNFGSSFRFLPVVQSMPYKTAAHQLHLIRRHRMAKMRLEWLRGSASTSAIAVWNAPKRSG